VSNVQPYTIGSQVLVPNLSPQNYDQDPRGYIWLWEKPIHTATYVMAIDPSVGRTGWCRATRTEDDYRTDNGAIFIMRCGVNGLPDTQVAEYAGPVDAEEIGTIANALGRLYAGKEEMAICIIEMYPGPGLLTYRRMMDLGYTNHFVWKYLDNAGGALKFGFWPGRESNKYLWIRASRHFHNKGLVVKSPWLVEEMRNCEVDPVKMWGRAVYGTHDDRVRAMMMALWAAHDWSMQVDTATPVVTEGKVVDWQRSDITAEQLADAWEERFLELQEA